MVDAISGERVRLVAEVLLDALNEADPDAFLAEHDDNPDPEFQEIIIDGRFHAPTLVRALLARLESAGLLSAGEGKNG